MGWISVKDRLPKPSEGRILAYCKIAEKIFSQNVLMWNGDFWCIDETGFGFEGIDLEFTHWMPLPEPPKEE